MDGLLSITDTNGTRWIVRASSLSSFEKDLERKTAVFAYPDEGALAKPPIFHVRTKHIVSYSVRS